MFEYFTIDTAIAMFFAFIGCAIRYGELHKKKAAAFSWFLIDSFIAIFMGYITWLELTVELEISLVHTILVCMLVGNIGSKVLTIIKAIVVSKVEPMISHLVPNLTDYLHSEEHDNKEIKNDKHDDDDSDVSRKEQ